MAAKFFCDQCGKEIFQGLEDWEKQTTTIAEIEKRCLCSDCVLLEVQQQRAGATTEACEST